MPTTYVYVMVDRATGAKVKVRLVDCTKPATPKQEAKVLDVLRDMLDQAQTKSGLRDLIGDAVMSGMDVEFEPTIGGSQAED